MPNVVREDVVKVTFDVNDKPLTKVDSGIDRLVQSTTRMAGPSGVGSITKGFQGIAKSAASLDKGATAVKNITDGIAEFDARVAVAKDKFSSIKKVATQLAHPIQTLDKAILTVQMSAGRTVAEFKRMAATKFSKVKTDLTNVKNALTQGQTGAKGFATAVKNIGKVSLNSLANGVEKLTSNIKSKAVSAAQKLKTNISNLAKTSLSKVLNGVKKLGSGLKSALSTAGKLAVKLGALTLKGLGAGVAALGTAAAAAGAGIFKLSDMASDLEETQNKVNVAFGDDAGKQVQEWANNSVKSMGLARQTALDMTALFGDMGTSMGLTQNEAADMSMNLTQLGADLASFKNMDVEEVTTALNGVFTGETESLKRLGVVMTQTNLEQFALSQGITKSIDKMTEAEKVQLRYAYVMEKTANAQGDFERTGGGFANQLRMLKEQFKEMGTNIGQSFLPAMTNGLKVLNGFATELNDIFKDGIQEGDFGKIGDVIGRAMTKGMEALQNGLPKVISFISSLVGTLAQSILPMIPQILTTLVQGVTEIFTNLVSIIQQNGPTLVNGLVELFSSIADGLLTFLPQLLVVGAQLIVQLAAGIAQQLPALVPKAIEAITTIVNGLLGSIDQLIQCGLQLIQGLIQGLVQNLPQIAMAAIQLLQGLADSLLRNLPLIVQTAIQLITSLCDGLLMNLPAIIQAAMQLVMGLTQGLIQNIDLIIQGALQLIMALTQGLLQCLPQILQAAMQLVFGLVQGITQNLNLIVQAGFNLIIGLIQGIVQMLPQILLTGVQLILQLVTGIAQNLPTIINAGIQLILSLIFGLIQAVPQLLAMIPQIFASFIEGIFAINWLEVGWQLITGILNGVWEGAKSLVSGVWDGIKGLFGSEGSSTGTETGTATVNNLANSINSSSGTAVSAVTNMSTQVNTAATDGISSLVSTTDTQLQGVPEAYTTKFSESQQITANAMKNVKSTVAKTNLYSSGVSIMQGLNRGMRSQIPALIATAQEAARAIKSATNTTLDIHSPSRVMEESGEYTGLGQIKGLRNTIPEMQIAAREVSNASIPYDSYSPESSTYSYGGDSEYTTISPQFNLTISGTSDDRAMARRVKRYVAEAIQDTFESLERKTSRVREA